MNRHEILLAIIAAAGKHPLNPVHLQKVAFLVGQEFEHDLPANYYEFDKHRSGPFSAEIYQDAQMLEYWGQIHISQSNQSSKREYSASEQVSFGECRLPDHVKRYIRETVDWARQQSFQELVRSIYYLYPEYRENSIFDYSEDEALLESIHRGLRQHRGGKTKPAREWLETMRQELETDAHADPAFG